MKAYFGLLSAAVALSAACVFAPAWAREPVPVVLENGAAIAGDIAKAQGAQQPFGVQLSCKFGGFGQCVANAPVSPSARLVIEFVTARCETTSPSPIVSAASLTTTVGPNAAAVHWLRLQVQGPAQVVSELVKIYADPGTTVSFTAAATTQFGDCIITLSGQMVSVP
jgi:hypothetical protein